MEIKRVYADIDGTICDPLAHLISAYEVIGLHIDPDKFRHALKLLKYFPEKQDVDDASKVMIFLVMLWNKNKIKKSMGDYYRGEGKVFLEVSELFEALRLSDIDIEFVTRNYSDKPRSNVTSLLQRSNPNLVIDKKNLKCVQPWQTKSRVLKKSLLENGISGEEALFLSDELGDFRSAINAGIPAHNIKIRTDGFDHPDRLKGMQTGETSKALSLISKRQRIFVPEDCLVDSTAEMVTWARARCQGAIALTTPA